jgi:RNA polymerase sigma factor (sigma-70 family)
VNALSDPQLLRAYAERRSEAAFAELVRRHIDLVHSAAVRMVNDPHLAKDVTQGVFVALAKDAGKLTDHPVLSGWLHRTARNIAAQTVRTEVRRRTREKEAAAMNEDRETEAPWEEIAPHLDAALAELSEPDRDAVRELEDLLRSRPGDLAFVHELALEARRFPHPRGFGHSGGEAISGRRFSALGRTHRRTRNGRGDERYPSSFFRQCFCET